MAVKESLPSPDELTEDQQEAVEWVREILDEHEAREFGSTQQQAAD